MPNQTVHIEVHFLISLPRGYTLTQKFLREVWELWLDTGRTPKHIKITAITWRNQQANTPAEIGHARKNFRSVFYSAQVTFKPDTVSGSKDSES